MPSLSAFFTKKRAPRDAEAITKKCRLGSNVVELSEAVFIALFALFGRWTTIHRYTYACHFHKYAHLLCINA